MMLNIKKILALFAFVFVFANATYANINKSFDANVESKRLDVGTCLNLQLVNQINTDNMLIGDSFQAVLKNDLKEGKVLILPKGTLIRGTIADIKQKKRPSKSAVLYLKFDHIVTPNGRQLPFKGSLFNLANLTIDGGVDGGGNYFSELKRNCKSSGEILKTTNEWGFESGEWLNGYGKIVTCPVAWVGGGIGAFGYLLGDSVADLFKKGKNVNLTKNSTIDVLLTNPIDVPTN